MLFNVSKAAVAALLLLSGASAAPKKPCSGNGPKPPRCPKSLDVADDVHCMAKINGNRLEVKVEGAQDGPTILVAPSTFGHSYWYMQQALKPYYDDMRFIYWDARGSGPFSSKPKNPIKTMSTAAMSEDIEGIRRLFGLDKVNLFSHCQGATSALIYAGKHADKVDNLYLAETLVFDGVSSDDLTEYQGKVVQELMEHNPDIDYMPSLELIPVMADPDDPKFPKTNKAAWEAFKTISKVYFWNADKHQDFVNDMEAKNAPPFSAFALEWNTRADAKNPTLLGPLLEDIKAKVHLLQGEIDGAAPKPMFDLLVDSLNVTGDNAVLVPEAGHIIWHDAPEAFDDTLSGWFDQLLEDNGDECDA
ncbi:alpha/beta-hydrolase [Sarocladium strictum]